jgi:hypothetical protein
MCQLTPKAASKHSAFVSADLQGYTPPSLRPIQAMLTEEGFGHAVEWASVVPLVQISEEILCGRELHRGCGSQSQMSNHISFLFDETLSS